MLKRLKIISWLVIAGLMLAFTFSTVERAQAQTVCPGVPFDTGWLHVPVVPLTPPDFVHGLLGTIESFGGANVGGLSSAWDNQFPFADTTQTGSQLASWWTQKNSRNTLLHVTNTFAAPVAVHVQILAENCVEIRDFCDFYTGFDSHIYDFSNIVSNAGQDISEANIQGFEGTVVITAVADCSLGSFFPAIDFDFLQGNVTIQDPNTVDYGANVFARLADSSTETFSCTTLTGDIGCQFFANVPSVLRKDFNTLVGPAAADLVLLQYADLYGFMYMAVPAFSQFGPFIITDEFENDESCTPIVTCFARAGIDDALPISEAFAPTVTPTPTPTPTPCTSDEDCAVNEFCDIPEGEEEGTCEPVPCASDADCPEGSVCDVDAGFCIVPTPTATPTPDGDGGGGGGCAVAGPVSIGTAMANLILPLIPVAFAFGLGALRRRNRKEDK